MYQSCFLNIGLWWILSKFIQNNGRRYWQEVRGAAFIEKSFISVVQWFNVQSVSDNVFEKNIYAGQML